MKSQRVVLLGAAAFLVAWFLPVIKGGVTLPDGLPGWQAFRVAAAPVWPYADFTSDSGYRAVLTTASAATNLVMLTVLFGIARGRQQWARRSAVAALASFLVNAQWVIYEGRGDLRAGYYLWWISFLLIAYASLLVDSVHRAPSPDRALRPDPGVG